MKLTDDEKAMLDGEHGLTVQKAMELQVRYGTALGAERFVNITNALGGYQLESVADWPCDKSIPSVFAQLGLDSDEIVPAPCAKVPFYYNQAYMDPKYYPIWNRNKTDYDRFMEHEEFMTGTGMNLIYSCTPYLCGNLPAKGEHLAWMESSAIVYANSVLGARTNTEGCESAYSAMLTGKTPYWGYHMPENRFGDHLVVVETDIETEEDWGLLGYYVGCMVQERIPVLRIEPKNLTSDKLKHFGAAAASGGGVEMYHIPGVTPEAYDEATAFGPNKPINTFKFGKEEKRWTYEKLNVTGKSTDVDFIVLGCPHYSVNQLWQVFNKMKGKKVKDGIEFWVFVPRQIQFLAERSGILQPLLAAGVKVMSDGCPCMGRCRPEGTNVVATDSAKQAHYLPNMTGLQTLYGSLDECINAAVTGKWEGRLK
ncbi:MAG: aconitase X catalytic domain-containing protein [Firmicutes bacterium]|nr:DUF521 domain-containing protein [Clostridiales bacterium]MBQ9930923.1 aconitase X catalytic domain-containing protein [Bacillota bacterium]